MYSGGREGVHWEQMLECTKNFAKMCGSPYILSHPIHYGYLNKGNPLAINFLTHEETTSIVLSIS